MSLWTAADAAAATGGTATTDWSATGVSIDTRTIEPGDLFVALQAARDGHDFVAQALEKGAAAALVSHLPDGVASGAPLLIVEDVLKGLEALGTAARARTEARVVAVTGSVGKTSTKEMLRAILSDQGRTHASVASYNNHWGVPLTLARMPADTEYAVIEIGMNHPGEIAPLAELARPHVAMITTVAAAHLEAFESIEGIAVEKASILEGLEPGGTAILNNDCSTAAILQAKAHDMKRRDIGFGEHGFDFVLKSVDLGREVTVVQATAHDAPLLFKVGAVGKHFAMNGLGALAAAEALGADLALAAQSLGRWSPYTGRGAREIIALDPVDPRMTLELIDDSYNANPTSMSAALDVLAAAQVTNDIGRVSKGRRIAFVGDMKELGRNGPDMHAAIADLEAIDAIDTVHCIGPLMQNLHAALPAEKQGLWSATSAEMEARVARRLDSGDVVLVKGSLSMNLARIVDAIRKMGHPSLTGADPQDNA
ncbi:UDP-N-acetylmuramoyl-tripeptide--D-alanyl-D-alanine ligase [uncultured Tateyamaria sp.]|uniref:UDP-N-acetylmuramoyl-tripeptide--D-alanyl-D- alanine ligase n=1 Tax=uncultured Tateyamaria sp. TaxID=455651 RepID=UPI00260E8666|nr:UDP-N-acetylmuramoyl-tripeptide--D-alanyl-D-alanine ligase [uncultured Tateyamaria sp.]